MDKSGNDCVVSKNVELGVRGGSKNQKGIGDVVAFGVHVDEAGYRAWGAEEAIDEHVGMEFLSFL